MIREFQVTLFNKEGHYRPVSCIVKYESKSIVLSAEEKRAVLKLGTEKICIKRGWDSYYLKKYGYLNGKVRLYDVEKIAEENKARYEAIKEAKYASGEWKRPKNEAN